MFGLSSIRRAASSPPRLSSRPSLEPLEYRYALNGPGGIIGVIGPQLPTLTISVAYGWGRTVTLSGELYGVDRVGGVTIEITGQADGTTTTDSQGNYSITLTADGLGTVYAEAVGTAAQAMDELWDVPPEITSFVATEGQDRVWTLSGTVTYHRPFNSLPVSFGGVPVSIAGGGTSTDSSGSFSWLVRLNGTASDNGLAWAMATSPWGLESEKSYVNIHQTGT